MCRVIQTSFFLSHGIRRNVNVLASLGGSGGKGKGAKAEHHGPSTPTTTVAIMGTHVTHLKPNERQIAVLLKRTLVCQTTSLCLKTNAHTHAHTRAHTRTRTRTHAHTHTHSTNPLRNKHQQHLYLSPEHLHLRQLPHLERLQKTNASLDFQSTL